MSEPKTIVSRYSLAVIAVGSAYLLGKLFEPWLDECSPLLPFSIAILLSSLVAGTGPGLLATSLSAVLGLFWFFPSEDGHGTTLPQLLLFLSLSSTILWVTHANIQSRERGIAARRALERREEELRTVIDALPVGVWFTDHRGKVLSVNQAGRKIWGGVRYIGVEDYESCKMWDTQTGQRISWEDYPNVRALKGEVVLNEIVEIETFTGNRRHVSHSAVPLRVNDGPIIGTVIVGEDITERQATIAELQRAKEQAEAASLAKDRFLAILSHELRTPLTPVLMLAESLESNPMLPSALRLDASLIRRHVSLEARLIDDLLDLTRIEKGKLHLQKEFVNIHEVIGTAVEMVRSQAKTKGVDLLSDMRSNRVYVEVDRARLKQVVLNLLTNALKFTPAGGKISVSTQAIGELIRISVRDTGVGIAEESLHAIFDAFEQGDTASRRFGGLGLGLAIARSLVELHGGHIRAFSAGIGKGSTFEVDLAAFEEPPHPSGPEEDQEHAAEKRLRIVLVEDHEPTAFVLARLLRRRGHEVRMAASVREAMAIDDTPLDLLVSDIGLPDGTGIDVIRHFRSTQRDFHAIALSGFGMESDVENSLNAGFERHLTKPVEFRTLLKTISELYETSPKAS